MSAVDKYNKAQAIYRMNVGDRCAHELFGINLILFVQNEERWKLSSRIFAMACGWR